jgi:RNA polymerase sigma factor (sigma-70 family)
MKIQPATPPLESRQADGRRETELMVEFQTRRDHPAFEALYRAAAPGLLVWIQRLHTQRRDGGDPRETLQDTFLNIYRYAGSFKPAAPGGFRAWARTIAGNALRRTRRGNARRAALLGDLGDGAPEPADRRLEPSAAASLGELSSSTRSGLALVLLQYASCLQQLSQRDQQALQMVEVEGRSYADVGEALGTERSNTKMVVFRARKRLQALVNASLSGPFRGRASQGEVVGLAMVRQSA